MQTDLMQTLRWMRMIGDTVFALGALAFVYFALDLMWQRPEKKAVIVPPPAAAEVV
jgi:nitric oxide reductase subunit B